MNSIKAPGSEKWEPPSATSKAPISPNTQNQSRVAPVHSDKAQTDVQTLQKQHTLIGLLIGLAIIAVLIYGYLTISFANDLQSTPGKTIMGTMLQFQQTSQTPR